MTTGVLVMSYGTPRDRDDIEAYYTDIRRGRPPTPDLLADLQRRYDAIGGTFPLRAITDMQATALAHALGAEFAVAQGTKHSSPSIDDGMRALASVPVQRVVGLVLAPHASPALRDYAERASSAGAAHGLQVTTVSSWHLLPAYVEFLRRAVLDALRAVPAGSEVVFTAHSLPERIAGEVYPQQLRATAAAVAAAAGVDRWSVAWQSAGRTDDTWLGPDILEVVDDRARAHAPGLVVCACGFVADHLEVAYDLDIEAARRAAERGLPFARTVSVNADESVMTALAGLVEAMAR